MPIDYPNDALKPLKRLGIILTAVLLAGCASFSQDGGLKDVSALAQERTGQAVQFNKTDADASAARAKVSELLKQPLSPDAAVNIALLNNQGLQASLSELGVAEADLVQAGRMRNPGFSFSRLRGGEDIEIDRSIMFDIVGLLTIPFRSGIEQRRLEQTKQQAATKADGQATDEC